MRGLRDTKKLKALLRQGKSIELRDRNRLIGRIVPETQAPEAVESLFQSTNEPEGCCCGGQLQASEMRGVASTTSHCVTRVDGVDVINPLALRAVALMHGRCAESRVERWAQACAVRQAP